MTTVFQVVDHHRYEGDGSYAMCSTFEKAVAIAQHVFTNDAINGKILIYAHEVDIYPDVVVKVYDHDGNPVGDDPV
jgi:hypothetical protein